jgi:hypothetical protein
MQGYKFHVDDKFQYLPFFYKIIETYVAHEWSFTTTTVSYIYQYETSFAIQNLVCNIISSMLCCRTAREFCSWKTIHSETHDLILRRSLKSVRIVSWRDGHWSRNYSPCCSASSFSSTRSQLGIKIHNPNFTSNVTRPNRRTFIPKKAPITLTETARKFFLALIQTKTTTDTSNHDVHPSHATKGIVLQYQQSSTGEPRMVFSFDFIQDKDLSVDEYETVSLEVMEDGSPKPPELSLMDGKPKLYIHRNAFMKVLGGKLDVTLDTLQIVMYDRDGNVLDPNV